MARLPPWLRSTIRAFWGDDFVDDGGAHHYMTTAHMAAELGVSTYQVRQAMAETGDGELADSCARMNTIAAEGHARMWSITKAAWAAERPLKATTAGQHHHFRPLVALPRARASGEALPLL